jgi:hypothetical protein
METHTDECGITEFTDACGSKKGVADDELLEEEIGSCAGSNWNHVSGGDVYVPNHPILVGSAACDANLVVRWDAPNENGAEITDYEIILYEANGPELRSVSMAPEELTQKDGTLQFEESGLGPGDYRVMVTATNMFGPGAAGATQVISVAATSAPKMPQLNVWNDDGKIVASAIPDGDDICNLPKEYLFEAFSVATPGSHGKKVKEVTSVTSQVSFHTNDFKPSSVRVGDELLVGTSYTFKVTAINSQGKATTAMSKPVRAMGKPGTPVISTCKNGLFGCKVTNNCTGSVRFTWPPVSQNGVTGGDVHYNVRAYIRSQLLPAKEYTVTSEMFEDEDMSWAIGKEVMFAVQAKDTKTTWVGEWSMRTPEIMMPGPPPLPTVALTPGINSVQVAWDSSTMPWYDGEEIKMYKLVGLSKDSSEVVNERICILRTCSSSTTMPAKCKNTECASMAFEGQDWLQENADGVTFTVKAEAADHSNCPAQAQVTDADGKPTKIHPVTVPDPPKQVMVDSVYGSGAITVNFPASTTYVDAPILSYTVTVYRWNGPDNSPTELSKKVEVRDIAKDQLSFTYEDANFDYNRDHFVKIEATNVVGTGKPSQMSNTVTVAPKESNAAQNVRDAKAGKIPSVTVKFAVTLPGTDASDFNNDIQDYYADAVADAVDVLPEYVEIVKVSTVACANPECSMFIEQDDDAADDYSERRLGDFPTAVQLDFQITLPAPDSASFAAAQADAATTVSIINLNPDLFLDDMTSSLKKSDMSARYPRVRYPESVFVGAPSSTEMSPEDLEGGSSKKQLVPGVSDFATVVMIVGAVCALMGAILFVGAKERLMSGGSSPNTGLALPIDRDSILGTAPPAKGGADTGWQRAELQSPLDRSAQAAGETSFFDEDSSFNSINPALAKGKNRAALSRPSQGGAGAGGSGRSSALGSKMGGQKKKVDLGRRSEQSKNAGGRPSGRPSDLGTSSSSLGARRSTTKVRKSESRAGASRDSDLARESDFDAGALNAGVTLPQSGLAAMNFDDEDDDRTRTESSVSTISTRTHSVDV